MRLVLWIMTVHHRGRHRPARADVALLFESGLDAEAISLTADTLSFLFLGLAAHSPVMPITEIMQGLQHRERALGTHWWNPPFLVPLVEVIGTRWTSQAAIDFTMKLHADAGKQPAHVKKDVPGFIGNRLQHALWREAVSLVERGICDAETVDKVIKAAFGRRLAVLGPLENADLVGTDLTLAIHKTVLPDIDNRPGPSPYLERLVAEGKLGFKSGEGFRKWSAEEQAALRIKVLQHLKKARDA